MHADRRPLTAHNEETRLPLPQAFVACVNCHGHEARGIEEAGTVSSDIRWETLTKPYDLRRLDGRRRAPYDAAAFFTALTDGRDSSGHALDSAMPRFALSAADAEDLLAYLQRLANPVNHGVSDDAVRVGVVSSRDVADAATAESDWQLLSCWFRDLNDQGGVFRRRIELIRIEAEALHSAPSVLALLAIARNDGHSVAIDAPPGVPLIGAVADSVAEDSRYRFALYPGIVTRARLLALYALARDPASKPQLALVYPDSSVSPELLASVLVELKPLAEVKSIGFASARSDEAVDALREAGADNVLVLGSGDDLDALIANVRRRAWDPLLLWIERPRNNVEGIRAVTVEPALLSDVTPSAGASYARCVELATTNERDRRRQLTLLASAQLLVTALEQGGRDIGRERLVETLHGLREFRSGFAPPGSLTAQRHTAASGAYVVPLPKSSLQPEPLWMMLD